MHLRRYLHLKHIKVCMVWIITYVVVLLLTYGYTSRPYKTKYGHTPAFLKYLRAKYSGSIFYKIEHISFLDKVGLSPEQQKEVIIYLDSLGLPPEQQKEIIIFLDKLGISPGEKEEINIFLDRFRLSPKQRGALDIYLSIPRYPINGTGVSVDITSDFEPRVINVLCSQNLSCVIPIYSAVDRFQSRVSIRESLGKLANKFRCKIFFIVGVSKIRSINEKLKYEYKRESDILVINKLDTYRDLNNKAYAMIKWLSEQCLNVPYVVHLIDDTYINLKWILERLHSIHEEYYILAPVAKKYRTQRDHPRTSVTSQEYPYQRFPHYAYGWVTAFPTRVAPRLLLAALSAYYCWIEDVWIGGHVRIAAGVKLEEIPESIWEIHLPPIATYNLNMPNKIVIHGVQSELLARFYNTHVLDSQYLPHN